MSTIFKYLIYVSVWLCAYRAIAQYSAGIDSIKQQLTIATHDTTRIKIYLQLVEAISNDEEWPQYNTKALELIEKNLPSAKGELKKFYTGAKGDVYNNLGYLYNLKGDIEGALEAFEKYRILSEEVGDKESIAYAYNNMGVIHNHRGDIRKALEYYQKSLKMYEEIGDKRGIAFSLNNIGYINQQQGDIQKAVECLQKSLAMRIEMKDRSGTAVSLNNLANVYIDRGDYEKSLDLIQQSIKIRTEIEDLDGLGHSYNNLGIIYNKKSDLDTSLMWFEKALAVFYQLDNKLGQTGVLNSISDIYIKKNNPDKAKEYTEKSLALAKELGYPDLISSGAKNLFIVYNMKKDYKNALEAFQLHVSMKDSITNVANRKLSLQQQFQYEYDKKEAELRLTQEKTNLIHEQQVQRQRLIILVSVIILLIVAVFSVFLWNRFKIINKQKGIIEIQKQQSDYQKAIVEKKNREITYSIEYAQKIQNALLPSQDLLKQSFPDSFVIFKPKDIVSGDFYWISDKDTHIFYATADCTGHGVPGGFMSMLGTALLNEIIDERKVFDCGEILTLMREKIMQALKQAGENENKDGMDMVLIRIDKQTLQMQYAAANNSFYIVSRHETQDMRQEISSLKSHISNLHEMQCDKMPVGVYHSEVKPFSTYTYQLQKGDIIYTYTDGYADQFGGEKGKKYTYKRLREKLVTISQEPLEKQKVILDNEFENWKACPNTESGRDGQEQIDDVCLIGVKI